MQKFRLGVSIFFKKFFRFTITILVDEFRYIGEIHWDRRRPSRHERTTQPMANPIITVTEHTPTPSPDYLKRPVCTIYQLFYANAISRPLVDKYRGSTDLTHMLFISGRPVVVNSQIRFHFITIIIIGIICIIIQ